MRSWKTTLSGAISSAAGLVLALSQGGVVIPKWLTITAAFLMAGGMAALGFLGKDYNVTGTSGTPIIGPADSATK